MGTGLLSSAVSGMQSAQIGLQTAQHNISNQNTLGFNRQRIVQASNTAMLTGAGFIGQGAHVSTVERMYDQFLTTQVNRAQTTTSELETYTRKFRRSTICSPMPIRVCRQHCRTFSKVFSRSQQIQRNCLLGNPWFLRQKRWLLGSREWAIASSRCIRISTARSPRRWPR